MWAPRQVGWDYRGERWLTPPHLFFLMHATVLTAHLPIYVWLVRCRLCVVVYPTQRCTTPPPSYPFPACLPHTTPRLCRAFFPGRVYCGTLPHVAQFRYMPTTTPHMTPIYLPTFLHTFLFSGFPVLP